MSSAPTRADDHRLRGAGRASLRTVVAVVTLLAIGGVIAPSSALGQEADEGSSARLTITQLTGVLGPGSLPNNGGDAPFDAMAAPVDFEVRALVENDGSSGLDSLRLIVEVHPPTANRAALRRALTGDLASEPSHVHDTTIGDAAVLPPGAIAGVSDTFGRDEIDWADGAGGVHPVRIAVVRGTDVIDEVVTAVVWLGELPGSPLLTTLVWPLGTAPWRTVGGSYASTVDRDARPGGRLDVLIRTLEQTSGAPVLLAPAAHLLEDLGDRTDGYTVLERKDDGALESRTIASDDRSARESSDTLRRIRDVAAALPHAPVASSYVDADLSALHAAGGPLRELAGELAIDGRRRLQRQLGREVDGATFLLRDAIDAPVLDLLPGETLLIPHRITREPGLDQGAVVPAPIRSLRTPSGRLIDAVIADPYLEEALDSPSHPAGPLVAAHRVVAESAMAYFQAAGSDGHTLLLLPPTTWDPSPTASASLLDGLMSATWLRFVSPNEQAAMGRRSSHAVEFEPAPNGPFPASYTASLATAVDQLDAVVAALPEGMTRIQDRSPTELRDILLRSTSSWYRGGGEAEAEALIRDVQRIIDRTFGDVEVATGSVTLTSDTGSIPVTLQRSRGGPITVAVEVTSQGRLLWPEGRRSEPLVLEDGTAQTVSFATRALSTGTFPVTVRVTDPTGAHELHRTTMSVRSTAISGPALAATGLLVLALLLAGALRKRRDTPRLEVVG